jgi:hypothetical protein
MSWDIFVQDLPRNAKCVADIPADFVPSSLGKRSTIIEKIKQVIPSAEFSDPSWGQIEGNDWSIEVNMGDNEDCDGFVFHIRGENTAIGVAAAILQHLGLRALDSQTGEFFVGGADAEESLRKWRAYRDHLS